MMPNSFNEMNYVSQQENLSSSLHSCCKSNKDGETKTCCSKTKKNKCHNSEEGECTCKFKINNNLLSFIQVEFSSKTEVFSQNIFPIYNSIIPNSISAAIWLPPKIS